MTSKETLEGRLADLEEKLETTEGHDRLDALEGRLEGNVAEIYDRLHVLEGNQVELYGALLGYLRADMATPWLGSAKTLEAVLLRLLK